MANAAKKTGFWDAELAAKVIEAYAEGDQEGFLNNDFFSSLTEGECVDIGIAPSRRIILKLVLETAHPSVLFEHAGSGEVTDNERVSLSKYGFSSEFIEALGGVDGKRALFERVKWLGGHVARPSWLFGGPSDDTRKRRIHELGVMGPASVAAVPTLIKIVKDSEEDEGVREQTASSIGFVGKLSGQNISELTEVLNDRKQGRSLRAIIAGILGKMGPDAEAVIPALVDILRNENWDEDDLFRLLQALGDVGSGNFDVAEALKDKLNSDPDRNFYVISGVLKRIGVVAVAVLVRELDVKDSEIRAVAANVLQKIGAGARLAIPKLEIMGENDPDPKCRAAAKGALKEIQRGIP